MLRRVGKTVLAPLFARPLPLSTSSTITRQLSVAASGAPFHVESKMPVGESKSRAAESKAIFRRPYRKKQKGSAIHRAPTPPKQEKTVVILGGRSQLGEAVRNQYLAAGWKVVCTTQGGVNTKLNEERLHYEGRVDFGSPQARTKQYWIQLFQKIRQEQGPIHTVVNCAGISINDPKTGYTMEDINTKPVPFILQACIALNIKQHTFVSTQAVTYPETRKPNSYSGSKYQAELHIADVMSDNPEATTAVSIIRPDLIISADNPGHFGSPQRMSTIPFVKVVVGDDPKKAGNTLLQPVAAHDVADAIVNISDYGIRTAQPVDACGPIPISLGDLLSLCKERQHKRFLITLRVPTAALLPLADIWPWGAFERDHLELVGHHEQHEIEPVDTAAFEKIVALRRGKDGPTPGKSLMTIYEIFGASKRPLFGSHDLGLYTQTLIQKGLQAKHLPPLFKGLWAAATQSRVGFNPHSRTAEAKDEGVNIGVLVASMTAAGLLAKHAHEQSESPSVTAGQEAEKSFRR